MFSCLICEAWIRLATSGSCANDIKGANSLTFWQNNTGPIRFVNNNNETMYLSGTGQVGIGTASPGSVALDVIGTGANNSAILVPRLTTALRPAGANGMIRYNTNTNKFEFFENNAWVNYGTGSGSTSFPLLASPGTTPSTAPSYSFASDSDTGLYSPGVGTASLATNGTARMTVDSSGNVGIGTASASGLLHVAKNQAAATEIYLTNTNTASGSNSNIHMAAGTPVLDIGVNGPNTSWSLQGTSEAYITAASSLLLWTNGPSPIRFANGNFETMRLDPDGKLGIGTASPGSVALDVVGTGANNSAILVPRLTTALRPAGANGMIRYNTNTNKFEFFENNAWVNYGTGASGSTSFPLLASPGTTPSTAPSYSFASDSDTGFYSPGVGTASLATNGTARMTVDSSGNVGIGTTSPSLTMDIQKNIDGDMGIRLGNPNTNSNSASGVYFSQAGSDKGWIGVNDDNSSYTAYANRFAVAASMNSSGLSLISDSKDIGFFTGPSAANEVVRITASGNVGIGTTSPGSVALDVVGTGANNSALLVPRLTTALRPAGANGMIRYNTNTNKFEFFENNAWVNYGTGSGGSTSFPLLASPGTTPSTAPSYAFASDSDTGFFSPGVGTASLATNGTARMTVDSSGYVGIGTTTPANQLDIYGSAASVAAQVKNVAASGYAFQGLENNNGTWGGQTVYGTTYAPGPATAYSAESYAIASNAANGIALISENATASIRMTTGGSTSTQERVRITSTGNVGIGTTTPASLLEIYKPTGTSDLFVLHGSSATSQSIAANVSNWPTTSQINARVKFIDDSNYGAHIAFETNRAGAASTTTTELMRLTSSGSLGIGTSSPGSAALDVVGTGANNSAILIPRNTTALRPAGANGMIRYNTSTSKFEFFENDAWVNYGTGGGGGGSASFPLLASPGTTPSTAPSYAFTSDSDTGFFSPGAGTAAFATNGTARMTIDSVGNVGIGTASPQAALDVSGTAKFRAGLNASVRVVTAAGAISVTNADYLICVNKSVGAATTVNLPSSPAVGDIYIVKDCKGDANTNNITLTPASGNIDGSATFVINVSRQSVGMFWDGTQWQIF